MMRLDILYSDRMERSPDRTVDNNADENTIVWSCRRYPCGAGATFLEGTMLGN